MVRQRTQKPQKSTKATAAAKKSEEKLTPTLYPVWEYNFYGDEMGATFRSFGALEDFKCKPNEYQSQWFRIRVIRDCMSTSSLREFQRYANYDTQ